MPGATGVLEPKRRARSRRRLAVARRGGRVGAALQRGGTDLRLFAPPFFGNCGVPAPGGLRRPDPAAVALVRWGPGLADRAAMEGGDPLPGSPLSSGPSRCRPPTGWSGLTRSVRSRYDYAAALPAVHRLGVPGFVRTYVTQLRGYPTHVKSHPPGMVVALRGLELVGLRGSGWAATAIVLVGASTTVAVGVTVRRLVGEPQARSLLPFLACSPWTLLVATSADAVYAATVAWAIALLALAATTSGRRQAFVLALAAGALVAARCTSATGSAPLVVALVLAVLLLTGRWHLLATVLAGAAAVLVAWTASGFDWLAGFAAARLLYAEGVAQVRPYSYFAVANLVVFAVMLGPAGVAALARRVEPRAAALVAAALAAVAVADLSGLSKGEVERIWLPFVPFVMVASYASLAVRHDGPGSPPQAATAVALQLLIVWPW